MSFQLVRIINKRNLALLVLVILLSVGLIYRIDLMRVADYSVGAWSASDRISNALDGAKSVVLVEFDDTGDTIRVAAGPKELAELRRATNRWVMPRIPEVFMCFDPHHRVEVVRADGSSFQFIICFGCRNFELNPPQTGFIALPDPWRQSLTALFKSAGMMRRSF